MSAPTKTKTWQHVVNQNIAASGTLLNTRKDILLKIVNTLIGFANNPWNVMASCDAASVSSITNLWLGRASLVWAQPPTAHSWIILQQAAMGANFQMAICLSANASTGHLIRISTCAAGFTAGTTTANPTANGTELILTANSGAVDNTSGWWALGSNTATDTASDLHFGMSTDGECTWWAHLDGGNCTGGFLFHKLANSQISGGVIQSWQSDATAAQFPFRYTRKNDAAKTFLQDGATLYSGYLAAPMISSGGTTQSIGEAVTAAGGISSRWPILDMSFIDGLTAQQGSAPLGTVPDLYWGSTGAGEGDTYDSKAWAQFGNMIFPWDGSTTPNNDGGAASTARTGDYVTGLLTYYDGTVTPLRPGGGRSFGSTRINGGLG